MLSYPHTASPFVVFLGIVGILTVPFLGVLVVLVAALGALAAFVAAIIATSYRLGDSVRHRGRKHVEAVYPDAVGPPAKVHAQLVLRDADWQGK